jgi:hypothetical protein
MFHITPQERRAIVFLGAAFFIGICCDIYFKLSPPGLEALRLLDEPPAEARVDINHASYEELVAVPGIGPSLAARIIYAREKKLFTSPAELRSIKGFSQKIFLQAVGRLRVGAP